MSGLLGTQATLLYDVTLLLEILIIPLLIIGWRLAKAGSLRRHGILMTTGVILHTLTILVAMIPSFLRYSGLLLENILSPGNFMTWVHVITGIIAWIMGIFLVAQWRLNRTSKMKCIKYSWIMPYLLVLWSFSLILGVAFYVYFYI